MKQINVLPGMDSKKLPRRSPAVSGKVMEPLEQPAFCSSFDEERRFMEDSL